ncbi:hypothetical protein KSP40_PGU013760 [Platanthera guangdongensis]|uniref:CRM domain-containing protein n=1 Tax=Platanthera guangdongensis TaxID=2320717 RepID=A0ABR2MYH0_9ASPA
MDTGVDMAVSELVLFSGIDLSVLQNVTRHMTQHHLTLHTVAFLDISYSSQPSLQAATPSCFWSHHRHFFPSPVASQHQPPPCFPAVQQSPPSANYTNWLQLKVHGSCPGELSDVIKLLESSTGSTAVSQIGRTLILYRPSPVKMEEDAKRSRTQQQRKKNHIKRWRKVQESGTFS